MCFLSVERRIVTGNDKNKKVKKGLTVGDRSVILVELSKIIVSLKETI